MTENKFGWKVGDGLRWTSPEGCDHDCVVTKAMAQMIEFETGEGEMKRLKGNNPSISRIDDSPHEAEPMTVQESKPESGLESVTEPKVESEQKTELDRDPRHARAGEGGRMRARRRARFRCVGGCGEDFRAPGRGGPDVWRRCGDIGPGQRGRLWPPGQ
jgi:hypothetical protein